MLTLLGVSALAAWTDHRSGRVPNTLTLPAIVGGVWFNGWAGFVALVLCVFSLPLLRSSWRVGGGDVKLLGALGALHPVVGIGVALAVVCGHATRISWRLGPSAFGWCVALACLLESR